MATELDFSDGAMPESAESLAALARSLLQDAQRLVAQQLQLLRREIQLELRRAMWAAILLGAGVGLAIVAIYCVLHAVVHALAYYQVLPLWGSYGAVGGALAGVAAGCLIYGGRRLARLRLVVPPQTSEALKENIQWIKHPTTTS